MKIIECRDGVLVDGSGGPFGVWCAETVLGGVSVADVPGDRVVVRSGAPEAGLVWSVAAWESFESALGGLLERAAAAGVRVCVRPAAGETVSDVPSCLRLLESWSERGLGVVLDPAGCVPPGSDELAVMEEFVDRAADLAGLGGVDAVVVRNVSESAGASVDGSGWLGIGEGLLPEAALGRLAAAAAGAGVPVVVVPDDAGRVAGVAGLA